MLDAAENPTTEYPGGFRSWSDYQYFRGLIEKSPDFQEIPARKPYSNVGGFVQLWYRHLPTGKTYRLVEPDGLFRGVWELILDDELKQIVRSKCVLSSYS